MMVGKIFGETKVFPASRSTDDSEEPGARNTMNFPKILVVDDDSVIHELVEEALSGPESLRKAKSGQEAMVMARADRPDLLLIDMAMPDIDGDEVCRRLKSHAEYASLPVLFMSGYDRVNNPWRSYEAGGVDFMAKPFKLDALKTKVDDLLRLTKGRRQVRETTDAAAAVVVDVMIGLGELTAVMETLQCFDLAEAPPFLDGIRPRVLARNLDAEGGERASAPAGAPGKMPARQQIDLLRKRLQVHQGRIDLLSHGPMTVDPDFFHRLRTRLAVLLEAALLQRSVNPSSDQVTKGRKADERDFLRFVGDSFAEIDGIHKENLARLQAAIDELIVQSEKALPASHEGDAAAGRLADAWRSARDDVGQMHASESELQNRVNAIVRALQAGKTPVGA